ncbi:hypothetical protein [Archangium primigenium]|uniref:hypothetical protein n=1 Tax=[Archangium] primigenium TaxID=2792470 RepID=UPI00195A4886|nr:hypothetical protein [Archangium primigenium]MBM7113549.1 hypothetical protein [Archangium primigenium]
MLRSFSTLLLCTAVAWPALAEEGDSRKQLLGESVSREDFGAFQRHLSRLTSPTGEADPPDAQSLVARWFQPPQYLRDPNLVPASEARLQKALARTRTLLLRNAYEQLQLEAAFAPLPNLEGVTPELRALSLKDDKGRPVAFTPNALAPIEAGRLLASGALSPDVDLQGFSKWSGTAEVVLALPAVSEPVRFEAKDVGQTTQGFTLEAWGARVQVRYTPVAGREATFLAFADNGLVLAPIKTSRLAVGERDLARQLSRQKWEDVPERLDAPDEDDAVVLTWDYSAPPARLDVFVPGAPVKRVVKLKLVSADEDTPAATLEEPAPEPRWCALDAAALSLAVRVDASRARGERFGTPVLFVRLPACDEGAFAEVRLEGLKYLTAAGEALPEVRLQEEGFQHASFSVPVSFSSALPTRSPEPVFKRLARVRGEVRVRWPRVRVVELSPKAPRADGVRATFAGKTVTLEQDSPWAERSLVPVGEAPAWVRDNPLFLGAAGQVLSGEVKPARTEGKVTRREYHFDTPPARVRWLHAAEVLPLSVPFDVTIPPPPPEPRGSGPLH